MTLTVVQYICFTWAALLWIVLMFLVTIKANRDHEKAWKPIKEALDKYDHVKSHYNMVLKDKDHPEHKDWCDICNLVL